MYTVLPNDSDVGHVERYGSGSSQPVHTFTQAELARGAIDYVHSGKSKMRKKSEGGEDKSSFVSTLRGSLVFRRSI